MNRIIAFSLFISLFIFSCQSGETKLEKNFYKTWSHYLGDPARTHYSSLDQINKENVGQLEVAWEYKTGDAAKNTVIQTNPLIADGMVYGVSPALKVFALDARTGEEIWSEKPLEQGGVARGLMRWTDGTDTRILVGLRQYVAAFDAKTGELVKGFGENGLLDLKKGFDRDVSEVSLEATSPGVIYKDLLIQGFLTSEGLPAVPGDIRAFDVRTGALKWTFHTIPRPGEYGYETFPENAWLYTGGANNWCGMTLDDERGIVFVPTGSAAFDFWGGDRKGDNLFANSLIALDANTGERIWHYQTVKHDIWDRDLPTPPTLVTVERDGKQIDAVAQPTKSGFVFLFNRETGEPLFPIEEKEYPPSDLYEEHTASTQPLPLKPEPFSRQRLDEGDINDFSKDKDSLLAVLRQSRSDGQFVPPSTEGTVIFPGFDGGAEWGGSGYDPNSNILYVNANEMPWVLTMLDIRGQGGKSLYDQGKKVYRNYCMICHGAELQGTQFHGNALPLIDLKSRLSPDSVHNILEKGRNTMPSFGFITEAERTAVIGFLMEDTVSVALEGVENVITLPYSHTGYIRFVDSEGYPAVKPPWGTLNAIDLNSGEIKWKVPLGEFEELTAKGIPKTGMENYGGPVVTAGGLVFIAATKDKYLRAFDKDTGEEVWRYKLPFASLATPATYEVGGKQYLVLASGGGKNTKERGDVYMAFALPDKE
ncbi:MAG: PQQ-binding-like beta-propeller repeat protein [Cyclobacteriaceae bacterium]|nr:PQQ-binding-like beta-propeller repeat protein [Cyclobacteriaceae bacterium]